MAAEPRYADEIRIPIKITLPWSGKLTRNGTPWPRDAKGRDWPSHRGRPVFPIDQLPHGFAPGTGSVYAEGDGRRETDRFAATDAAMRDEIRRAAAAVRLAADRGSGPANQSPIQQIAAHGTEEENEEEYEDKRLLPHLSLTVHLHGATTESTPAQGAVVRPPSFGGAKAPD